MPIHIDNPNFIDGWQAYFAGLPPQANPFLFEANPFRLWNCGFTSARLIDLASQGIFELPSDFDADLPEPGLRRVNKSPYDQGIVAYCKCIALDQCPYEPGSPDFILWQSGWISEQERQPELRFECQQPQPVKRVAWLPWLLDRWPFRRRP